MRSSRNVNSSLGGIASSSTSHGHSHTLGPQSAATSSKATHAAAHKSPTGATHPSASPLTSSKIQTSGQTSQREKHTPTRIPPPQMSAPNYSSHLYQPQSPAGLLPSVSYTAPTGANHEYQYLGVNSPTSFAQVSPMQPQTRRIWMKRLGGTPTTFAVSRFDIIDDLKQEAIKKFANTLGRYYDASDLIIKMDLLARLSSNSINKPGLRSDRNNSPQDISRASPSPPVQQLHPQLTQQNLTHSAGFSLVTLEPDQNVWSLIDNFYPAGFAMSEALIIEAPSAHAVLQLETIPHTSSHSQTQTDPNSYNSNSNRASFSMTENPNSAHKHLILGSLLLLLQTVSAGEVLQPKPQNTYMNKSLAPIGSSPMYESNSSLKDRSISPGSATTSKVSPMLHRRAQSNPPQSPTSNNQYNLPNNSSQNQAILLLPKKFSISQDNSSGFSDRKKYSLDKEYLKKQRSKSLSLKINNPSGGTSGNTLNSNLIGMGISSPISSPSTQPISYLSVTENGSSVENSPIEIKRRDNKLSINTSLGNSSKTDISRAKSPKPIASSEDSKKDTSGHKKVTNGSTNKSAANNATASFNSSTTSGLTNKPKGETLTTKSTLTNKLATNGKPTSARPNTTKPKTTTERVLPSISVLVVEDNAINQAILGAFLRKHKIHYKIAKNGQEAIDKWRQGGFHLVLMDIQLPVKSGIEATKEIRHLEKLNNIGVFTDNKVINSHYSEVQELKSDEVLDLNIFRSPVIIVALTASSDTSDDKKKALTAGCNDYLTKPVNLVWLQNKITEWGCMQALIDFDGWNRKKQIEKSSPKVTTPRTEKSGIFPAMPKSLNVADSSSTLNAAAASV